MQEEKRSKFIELRDKFNLYLYYIIIGVMTMLIVIFLPMIGSDVGLEFYEPDGALEWAIYIGCGVLSAGLNMAIFHAFKKQAKINISKHKRFIEAEEILLDLNIKNVLRTKIPRSPKQYQIKEYSIKGVLIVIFSMFSTLVMTQCALEYDFTILVTYILTVTISIIFGLFEMKKDEAYWIEEYYQYALYQKKLYEEENTLNDY